MLNAVSERRNDWSDPASFEGVAIVQVLPIAGDCGTLAASPTGFSAS